MSSKKDSALMEFFNPLIDSGLSPNQLYTLYSIREGTSPLFVNIHVELRILSADKWVELIPGTDTYKISSKADDLLTKVEGMFKTQRKKANVKIMGPDFSEMINRYQLLFPKKRLPSGKVGRSALSNVETNFKWFFDNHSFSWEVILKATEMYISEYEMKSPPYKFMRTSAYFIRKSELDKSIVSDLANYCEIVESGEDPTDDHHFSEKVV